MDENTPAQNGDDSTPEDTATLDTPNPADNPNPEGGDDTAVDTEADDQDPNAGIHPDALDPDDGGDGDEPELTDEEIKDSPRLRARLKSLTTKAREAKDLKIQNAQLLKEVTEARGTKPPKTDTPAPKKGKFTPEQLAQAKDLMDELGYVPKNEVDSLKTAIKQLTTDRVSERDKQAMHAAINQHKDESGAPIVTERHIQNAMRKWMQSEDPAIRNRVNMDYGAMIQLIGGTKIHGKPAKKPAAPQVPDGKGGKRDQFKPQEDDESAWDPSDPIGSQERSIARILQSMN